MSKWTPESHCDGRLLKSKKERNALKSRPLPDPHDLDGGIGVVPGSEETRRSFNPTRALRFRICLQDLFLEVFLSQNFPSFLSEPGWTL